MPSRGTVLEPSLHTSGYLLLTCFNPVTPHPPTLEGFPGRAPDPRRVGIVGILATRHYSPPISFVYSTPSPPSDPSLPRALIVKPVAMA